MMEIKLEDNDAGEMEGSQNDKREIGAVGGDLHNVVII